MPPSYEEVYRLALQLSPDERRQLAQRLAGSPSGLTTESILHTLDQHAAQLHDLGVRRIGLFGSHVRGEAQLDSDIDLLIEMAAEDYSLFDLLGVRLYLQDVLGQEVDAVPADSLRPELAPHILQEVIYAEGV